MATIKQKKAIEKIVENHGNVSKAMIEAGYSKASAKNPKNLTTSKGFRELLNEKLPEDHSLDRLRDLIDAEDVIIVKPTKGKTTTIKRLNHDAVARGLDMLFKIRGNYKPTQIDVRSFVGWTPEELEEYAATGSIPERFSNES